MTLQKGDLIQVEFTGKIKDGEVFDSNIKKDLQEAKLNIEPKPMVFASLYPESADDFDALKDALGKLKLKDSGMFPRRAGKIL